MSLSITVVIPAHDPAPWIDFTLETVAAQTRAPDAVIIVDDGSTDDTVARITAWKTRLPMLQLRQHVTPRGPSAARNAGWRAADTEVIAFVDADDLWHPAHLALLESAMERLQADVVCSRRILFESTPERPEGPPFPPIADAPSASLVASPARALFARNFIPQSAVLVRRAALARVGGYDEGRRLNEDYDLWCRLAPVERFAVVDAVTLAYRLHVRQASRSRRLDFESTRWPIRLPLRTVDRATADDDMAWQAVEAAVAETEFASAWRLRSAEMLAQIFQVTAAWPGATTVRRRWARRRWVYWPYRAVQAVYDVLPAALRRRLLPGRIRPVT